MSQGFTREDGIGNASYGICEGRLTLTTGVPVTTSDVTGAGTLYFTPYKGDKIGLFDGTNWKIYTFTEKSLSLTLTNAKNYDVFLYDNAGTLTLELSSAWTNDTTRADALTLQNGIYVKSGATTRRYLGTIRASGTNTTEYSRSKSFVWNLYNQVFRSHYIKETTSDWTYSAVATWRPLNNSTANRVEFISGLGLSKIRGDARISWMNGNSLTTYGSVAIGLDSTNTVATDSNRTGGGISYPGKGFGTAEYSGYAPIGYHYLQMLEYSNDNASNIQYFGYSEYNECGMTVSLFA